MKKVKLKNNVIKNNSKLNEGLITRMALHPQMQKVDLDVYSEALKVVQDHSRGYSNEDYTLLEAYSHIYNKITSNKSKIIKDVDQISQFYLVNVIIDQLTEDALTPEIGTDEILSISYPKNKKIEKELKRLEEELHLDQMLVNITPDLLKYGEYVLEADIDLPKNVKYKDELGSKPNKEYIKKHKGKGIVAIKDTVDQDKVVMLLQETKNVGFLVSDEKGKVIKKEPSAYIQFTLSGSRKRVKLSEQLPFQNVKANSKLQKLLDSLPKFIRIGRSEIHPFISKFKELDLLEKLIPATKLSKLSNVNLVGINVPGQYDIEKGLHAAKRVEGIVNQKVGVDKRLGEVTVQSILSVAGRTKVIPLFGDKGQLEKMDFKSDEPDELLGSSKEIRELILDSIGVPFELVYRNDDSSKGETLKRYARYLRKLKNIQRTLIDGVKQICCIHLTNMGIEDYNERDIVIEFRNKLVEIDNLDKLEHTDTTISTMANVRDFFMDMADPDNPFAEHVNLTAVSEWFNGQLKTIGLNDAFKSKLEGGKDTPKNLDRDGEVDGRDKQIDMNRNITRKKDKSSDGKEDADVNDPNDAMKANGKK